MLSPLSFSMRLFAFSTMIAFGVEMTRVSGQQYDHGVKGQGQIKSKLILWLETQTPLLTFDEECLYLAQLLPKHVVYITTNDLDH